MMNRVYSTAGIVIVIGVLLMFSGQALLMATSDKYWDDAAYGLDQWAADGKKRDQYAAISNFGLTIVGLGLAIMAFGLASQRPSQLQFREVPSNIPLEQYPQPPQSPR
jgi:hypothetical protein